MIDVGFFKSYLIVEYIVVSHKFCPTPYFNNNKDREPIHKRIFELHNQGLGHRKIHKILIKEGFKIGKTPSCVYTMIKNKLKRVEFLNQKETCEVKGVSIMVERG